MEYIHKLPFILGCFMAIVVGIINYSLGVEQQNIFTRVAISLVIFFITGLIIRNLLNDLLEELEKRKKEQEELEEQQRKAHSEMHNNELPEFGAQNSMSGSPRRIDYEVTDGEDFTPMKISELMRSSGDE